MVDPNPTVSSWDGLPRDHRLIDSCQKSPDQKSLIFGKLLGYDAGHLIKRIPIFRRCCNLATGQSLQPRWEFSLAHPSSFFSFHFQAFLPPFNSEILCVCPPPPQKHATQSHPNDCVAVAFACIVKSWQSKSHSVSPFQGFWNLGSATEAQNTDVSLIEPRIKYLHLCLKIPQTYSRGCWCFYLVLGLGRPIDYFFPKIGCLDFQIPYMASVPPSSAHLSTLSLVSRNPHFSLSSPWATKISSNESLGQWTILPTTLLLQANPI